MCILCVVQVYALAGHAHVGTCTSAIDLVHGFVNMHAAQPSVWHFSALIIVATTLTQVKLQYASRYIFLLLLVCTRSNHQVVEGADHQSVVQLIRNSGSQVHLVVVSVTSDESRKLEPENTGMSAMDYFERRSVPVSVPDTEKMRDDTGKEYVVFNIYLANKHTTSRRYREFDALNNNVSEFRNVN